MMMCNELLILNPQFCKNIVCGSFDYVVGVRRYAPSNKISRNKKQPHGIEPVGMNQRRRKIDGAPRLSEAPYLPAFKPKNFFKERK